MCFPLLALFLLGIKTVECPDNFKESLIIGADTVVCLANSKPDMEKPLLQFKPLLQLTCTV